MTYLTLQLSLLIEIEEWMRLLNDWNNTKAAVYGDFLRSAFYLLRRISIGEEQFRDKIFGFDGSNPGSNHG